MGVFDNIFYNGQRFLHFIEAHNRLNFTMYQGEGFLALLNRIRSEVDRNPSWLFHSDSFLRHMLIRNASMAPVINPKALNNSNKVPLPVEKLVMRPICPPPLHRIRSLEPHSFDDYGNLLPNNINVSKPFSNPNMLYYTSHQYESVYVGDIVAFKSPLVKPLVTEYSGDDYFPLSVPPFWMPRNDNVVDPEDEEMMKTLKCVDVDFDHTDTLVSRIVAMPGDELVSTESEDDIMVVPADHCWVMGDNADVEVGEAGDSRTFGPLPLANIVGRIVYAITSKAMHGAVENSMEGMKADRVVMAVEMPVIKRTIMSDWTPDK
jgi:hypothetical protein